MGIWVLIALPWGVMLKGTRCPELINGGFKNQGTCRMHSRNPTLHDFENALELQAMDSACFVVSLLFAWGNEGGDTIQGSNGATSYHKLYKHRI